MTLGPSGNMNKDCNKMRVAGNKAGAYLFGILYKYIDSGML